SRYAHAAFVVTSGFPNNTREDFESADPKVILGVVRYYDPRTFQPPREVLAFWDKKGDPLELDLNDPRVRAEGLGARAVDQRLWALEMAGIALDAGAPIPVRLQAACLFKREAIALRRLGAEFQDDAQERRFLTEQSERGVSGIGWLLALSGAYEVSVVAPKLAAAGLSGLAESLGGRGLFQFLLSPRGPALVLSSGGVVPLTAAQARLLALVAGVTLAIPAGSPLMMQAVKKAYQDMPNLSKLADKALADSRTKAEADQLLDKFRRGNNNPGKGTKALCAGVSYLRGNYGARVFFRMTSAGIEVLGIASKKVGGLEDKVIAAIRDRYCRGGNN
ncbi:MAG: hypothetical protein KGK30_09030, partial [Elusimicrobia bacterium]|nr:hypothetical protein [Elusimicrobiota bacterium]